MSFRRIIMGTAAMSSVSVLRLLAQFLIIPILSRLLSPVDYGLMAIAMPFVLFTMMFADAGVGRSVVRTSSEHKDVWSTCFWLSLLLGSGLALVMIACGPLAAWIFNEKQLSPIIMSLSVVILAQSVATIPGAALQQKHRFKTIAVIELTSLFCGIGSAIAVALSGGGAWALVGQQIVFYVIRAVLSVWYSPFRPSRLFSTQHLSEHLTFGRDIIVVGIVQMLSRWSDSIVIGKVLGSAALGFYSMGFQFARLPMMLVTGPLQYVLYAQLAQLKAHSRVVGETYLLINRMLAIVIFPAMAMVAVAHEPIFHWLLSEKWATSGYLFMLLAPACTLQTITSLSNTILMVLARTDRQLRLATEFALLWVAALVCAVPHGLPACVIAYNVAVFLFTPRLLSVLLPLIECSLARYLGSFIVPSLLSLAAAGIYVLLVGRYAPGMYACIALSMALAACAMVAAALLQKHSLLHDIKATRLNLSDR